MLAKSLFTVVLKQGRSDELVKLKNIGGRRSGARISLSIILEICAFLVVLVAKSCRVKPSLRCVENVNMIMALGTCAKAGEGG